jgi:hypothetical protein
MAMLSEYFKAGNSTSLSKLHLLSWRRQVLNVLDAIIETGVKVHLGVIIAGREFH